MATTLRVLTDGAMHAGRTSHGRSSRPSPRAKRPRPRRNVAACRRARSGDCRVRRALVHVALPPMPADRIPQAISFALEDQLAGPAGGHHLAASKRDGDGVDVAIVARPVIAPLARSFDRVVAEPAVARKAAAGAWRWYRSAASGGFVRRHDGSAFATSSVEVRGALPPELALPLRHAARATPTLTRVESRVCGRRRATAHLVGRRGSRRSSAPTRGDGTRTVQRSPPRSISCKATTRGRRAPHRCRCARACAGRRALRSRLRL